MNCEANILEDRIEVATLHGCRENPLERVRGGKDEEQKGHGDPSLNGEHIGFQFRRHVGAEGGDQRAEKGQDQRPEQHRAFVVAPDAGVFVDQRLGRMRMLIDEHQREIRLDEGLGQGGKGQSDEQELQGGGGRCDRHQPRIVGDPAPNGNDRLHNG